MSSNDLHYLDLVDVARRIKVGALSPVALTQAMLQRIEKLDGGLKSYATLTPELALKQARRPGRDRPAHILAAARRADRGQGPVLHRGHSTAAGMPMHNAFKPDHDATVVARFAEAGAVLLGKLQLTEGAFADHHPSITPPVNPWHQDHWSGASSSGSGVATAAGLCFALARLGHRRLDPLSVGGQRRHRPEADLGPGQPLRRLRAGGSLDHIGPMRRSAADARPCSA